MRWSTALACVIAVASLPALAEGGPRGDARRNGERGNAGRLVLTSETERAEVFIDGEPVGRIPLDKPVVLRPGKYTIKITKRGFTEFIDVVRIRPRQETRLDIDLLPVAGVVRLSANLAGARVFVDGKFAGETPLDTDVPAGVRVFRLTKGGYRDLTRTIEVIAGKEHELEVELEELPPGENPFRPLPPRPPRWYEKWWVWALVAGGTALLTASIAAASYYVTLDPIEAFNPQYCWGVGCR